MFFHVLVQGLYWQELRYSKWLKSLGHANIVSWYDPNPPCHRGFEAAYYSVTIAKRSGCSRDCRLMYKLHLLQISNDLRNA